MSLPAPTIQLSAVDLTVASLLLLVPASVSLGLRLGLEKRLAIAGLRTVCQLMLIGLVLKWLFQLDRWYAVVPILLIMLMSAARAAVQRCERSVPGAFGAAFFSLLVSSSLALFSATELVLDLENWATARYVIPLLGMLLGNGLTGISLSLDRFLADLETHKARVEARLALGASLWDAVRPWLRDAARTGMIPILNAMTIVGLVSLPGMMTGQILAGADPMQAISYQILILFMIACTTAIGCIGLCLLTFRALAHPEQRIRWDRILRRDRA